MKSKLIYGLIVGAAATMSLSSCDNNEYLSVTQYDILQPDVQFSNDEMALMGLNGIYAYNNVSKEDNSWGYKPNMFTGSHPTMDTQCTGWDVKFLDQTWDDGVGELGEGWAHAYSAIARANLFLASLKDAPDYNQATQMGITAACKATLEGEAKALRGYFYTWLATTFGRVPMLMEGEDYSASPNKASAETYDEMWDFIISDFKTAAEKLDWLPYNGNYGRCTKAMALAYLADAYMWKAYRQGCDELGVWTEAKSNEKKSVVDQCYKDAQKALLQIYDNENYDLVTNFATNWDPQGFWSKECIWAMVSDEGGQYSSWGGDRTITFCNPNMFKWFAACTNNGGWGAEFLSWEWFSSYEPGDMRRDASCATGNIDLEQMLKLYPEGSENYQRVQNGIEAEGERNKVEKKLDDLQKKMTADGYKPTHADTLEMQVYEKEIETLNKVIREKTGFATHGYHPYLQCVVGPTDVLTRSLHCGQGELAPSIWTTKFWRNAAADGNSWGEAMWTPTIVYAKRYANVLLDLAECTFRLTNGADGWQYIDELRKRAWGVNAVGQDYSAYCEYFNQLYKDEANFYVKNRKMDKYPFTVDDEPQVPSAREYYTKLAEQPNRVGYKHTSPAWKVAVNEERRKEFNSEWCLCPDMVKSGYIEDHINYNYPKDETKGDDLRKYPWSHRVFTYDAKKMDMPIPSKEILKNEAIQQNPAYRGGN